MHTVSVKAHVTEDGRLHLDVPAGVRPGPVDVIVVIQPAEPERSHDIRELRGRGAEIWPGIDAQEYVNRLRDG